MDINYIEGLKGIESAILNPRPYDWWILGVTFANVIAFVILTIYIYKLNKKVANDQKDIQTKIAKNQKEIQIEIANNQENLQKRNLKLQLFEKRYPLYQSIVDVREKFYLDAFDIYYHIEKFEKNDFQNELSQTLNILKYHSNSSRFLLDMDLGNDIENFIQTQHFFWINSLNWLLYIKLKNII
ncbi:MAG: hypothetical protein PHD62_01085 [Bacteroidales bacterium]|nr:hypothetical protein [Bacteroidales bacterium]MDD4531065.1 hypothetical protein [Candidatus Gracilibacteria bacterium]